MGSQHVPGGGAECATLVDVLRLRALEQPDRIAFTYLAGDGSEGAAITYGELERQARAIAVHLLGRARPGMRACLFYPPGIDYIAALFGCLYAGIYAVPAYPPRAKRRLPRLEALLDQASDVVALTTAKVLSLLKTSLEDGPAQVRNLEWIITNDLPHGSEASWCAPEIESSSLAIIQYTSGSTSSPKGVMLSHANLLHNLEEMKRAFRHTKESRLVAWLPPYHDMGLIGGILEPLYVGFEAYLMAPAAFLQRPFRWLEAISRYRATTSGAPNSAYDLCVQKISAKERKTLDLSSWELTTSGAEPLSAATIERFIQAFAPHGFRPEALRAGYGLAEATLVVTNSPHASTPQIRSVSVEALGQNRIVEALLGEKTARVVSCGFALRDTEILIVDPLTRRRSSAGNVGEIWIYGPSVAQGYWNNPEASKAVFEAQLADEPNGRRYLRTGDLGFLEDDQLFVTGRLKDLIIIEGVNHYPQDLETTAQYSDEALQPGACAAFSITEDEREHIVIVQEVRPRAEFDPEIVLRHIRQAVADVHGLAVEAVVLVKRGDVPRTTSGKVRRAECKSLYLAGTLPMLWQWRQKVQSSGAQVRTLEEIQAWLVDRLRSRLRLEDEIDVAHTFAELGLDSADAVSLSLELEDWLGRKTPPTLIWDFPTVESLSRHLAQPQEATPFKAAAHSAREPIAIVGMACRFPGAADPAAFWKMLHSGGSAISKVEPSRIADTNIGPDTFGGFLEEVDRFDSYFFGVSPREAAQMDPQQRLLMEVSWEAFENAGIPPSQLAGKPVGVFVGISNLDYGRLNSESDIYAGTGNTLSIAANRLSYFFDLKGASLAVDTACSSSGVAVHLACESLLRNESVAAIAGGVNLILAGQAGEIFEEAGMLAADGVCKPFDAAANGYVRSEGCSVVVLKRLSDAVRDGDRIIAQILATGVNQDGRSNGLTAPHGPSQQMLIRSTLEAAQLSTHDIDFIEAHGTGTPLGDPIEIQTLTTLFATHSESDTACWVGSVKANIGHLEPASGIAGLFKAVLSLENEAVPPQVNFKTLNPHIRLEGSRLNIPLVVEPWPRGLRRRIAGVSSFGFGGTNTFLVVSEGPEEAPAPEGLQLPELFCLSAKNLAALRELAGRFALHLLTENVSLGDVCFTANTGRQHFSYRLAAIADSTSVLAHALLAFGRGDQHHAIAFASPDGDQSASHVQRVTRNGQPSLVDFQSGYLDGASLDWRSFYSLSRARKISLPTYPFGRERHWLNEPSRKEIDSVPPYLRHCFQSHPFLRSRLHSALPTFAGEISLRTAPYLAGHTFNHQAIFPAAVYLDMALCAAREHFHSAAIQLSGISFLQAFFVDADAAVQLTLHPSSNSEAGWNIATSNCAGGEPAVWVDRCSGHAAIHSSRNDDCASSLEHAKEWCMEEQDADKIYQAFSQVGLAYEGAFRGMQRIWTRNAQALAYVEISAALTLGVDEYGIHPAFLDSCLQVLGCVIAADAPCLPIGVDRFTYFGGSPMRGWAHAAAVHQIDAENISGDISIFDMSGHPVAEVSGLRLKKVGALHNVTEVATRPLFYQVEWEPIPNAPMLSLEGHWLVTADAEGVANSVVDLLHAEGVSAEVIGEAGPTGADAAVSGLIHLSLFHGTDSNGVLDSNIDACLKVLRSLRSAEQSPRLCLVTRGARFTGFEEQVAASAGEACLWGLMSVIALEHPRLHCLCLDLDPATTDSALLADQIVRHLQISSETQIAVRGSRSLASRLNIAAIEMEAVQGLDIPASGRYVLSSTRLGDLGNLVVTPTSGHTLQPGEIAIRVHAAGLNFSDVMKGLGLYPRTNLENLVLGAECSGVIEEVAPDVQNLHVGDEVFGIAPHSFGAIARTSWKLMVRKPPNLSFEEAAGIPVAFLTALYALKTLARLRAGERVLIHSATGGVGLAAIQIAQEAGAAIYGTAGSAEKRSFLAGISLAGVACSRTPDFYTDIRKSTNGEGVDVVLNSLSGELMARSIDLLRPHGRFLEIGKTDIYAHRRLSLQPFEKALSFFAIDMDRLFRDRPDDVQELLREVAGKLQSGQYKPLPLRVYPLQEAVEAFRHMAHARHIGKIVFTPPGLLHSQALFRADATYLITGGQGALGLHLADFMVQEGARRFVLVGRSELASTALGRIAKWRAAGVEVVHKQADVSQREQLAAVIAEANGRGTLRGVFHLAGVLSDSVLSNISSSNLRDVLAPKVDGASSLHTLTAGLPLDYFVLFSSLASLTGSPGQGAYAAGNAFLDSLANWRNAQGLPGLSINWGPWLHGGMAKQSQTTRFASSGIHPMSPEQALNAFRMLLRSGQQGQFAVAAADWEKLLAMNHHRGKPPFYSRLAGISGNAGEVATPPEREHLSGLEPADRDAYLERRVTEHVSRVSGIAVDRIDPQQSLSQLGVDSMSGLELVGILESTLQMPIPMSIMSTEPSVRDLVLHIENALQTAAAR